MQAQSFDSISRKGDKISYVRGRLGLFSLYINMQAQSFDSISVTAWAGLAFVRQAVREERGQIYCAPKVLEITNQYHENDGVSKRVLGIVICFGSEG